MLYPGDFIMVIAFLVSSFVAPCIARAFYKAYQRMQEATSPERLQALLDRTENTDKAVVMVEPGVELVPEPTEPKTTSHGVRCEYCDSCVPVGTNCPNCGAVLPAQNENDVSDPFARFVKVSYDFGLSATSLSECAEAFDGIMQRRRKGVDRREL